MRPECGPGLAEERTDQARANRDKAPESLSAQLGPCMAALSQRDGTVGKAVTLHAADLGLIAGTPGVSRRPCWVWLLNETVHTVQSGMKGQGRHEGVEGGPVLRRGIGEP